jgi:hypothetical protein
MILAARDVSPDQARELLLRHGSVQKAMEWIDQNKIGE